MTGAPAADDLGPDELVAQVQASNAARREHAARYRDADPDDHEGDPTIMAAQLERDADAGDRAIEMFRSGPPDDADARAALHAFINPTPAYDQ